MPLAFLLCVWLSFGFLSLSLAGPQSTISHSIYLSSIIPSCAQSCLEAFIRHSFPTSVCPDQQDLDCLCTSNSNTGFTLGEGALQCVAASCTGEGERALGDAYEVCLQVGNAKSMTHFTLTATLRVPTPTVFSNTTDPTTTPEATTPSTFSTFVSTSASAVESSSYYSASSSLSSAVSTSISSPTVDSMPTGIITASGSPFIPIPFPTISPFSASSQDSLTKMSTKTSSPSSTSSETPAASAAPPALTPNLTKPQLAGVVVASVATAAIGFAILGFLLCIRRRRKKKRESDSSFVGDQIFEYGQDTPIHPRLVASDPNRVGREAKGAPERARGLLRVPSTCNESRWSIPWRKGLRPEDIVAPSVVYDTTQEPSPTSFASYRTASRLLPEKPSFSLFPTTPSPKPSRRPQSAVLRSAEGAPISLIPPIPPPKPTHQGRKPVDGSQALRQSSESRPPALRDPFVESCGDPRALMYAKEHERATRAQLPRIVTPSTSYNHGSSAAVSSDSTLPRHPPAIWPPPEYRWEGVLPYSVSNHNPPQENPGARAINRSEYISRPSYQSYHPHISTQLHPSKSASFARKTSGRRPMTHYTMSSDTSFEDDIEEIAELPRRSSMLSPVVEVRTPLSAIRYPTVPGNAASAMERRLSHTSPTRKPPRRQQHLQPLHINKSSKGEDQARPLRPERLSRTDSLLSKRRGPQEAAALMHDLRQGRNVSADIRGSNEDIQGSAKWKILCSPGMEGIGKSVSPHTPRSNQQTPTRPSRR